MALIRALSGSGGGGNVTQYTYPKSVVGGYIPSWDDTPIPPTKVYAIMSNGMTVLTNTNPDTGIVSDNTLWQSSDGGNNYTSRNDMWIVRSSNSVALSDYWSSNLITCLWILLDD